MSGIAAAQMQMHRKIQERRRERSFELGDHDRVMNQGATRLVCLDCKTRVQDDPHGRDILREASCNY